MFLRRKRFVKTFGNISGMYRDDYGTTCRLKSKVEGRCYDDSADLLFIKRQLNAIINEPTRQAGRHYVLVYYSI